MELLFLVLFSLHILKTEAVGHWCYLSQKPDQLQCKGPRQWYLIDATCQGNKQSPINIVTKDVIYDNSLQPLNFEGYDVKGSSKWNIENNGHTVKVNLGTSPKIGGGGLKRKYKAVEFHFHWGTQMMQQYLPGSEHSIDGEKQAMELHVVHIREDVVNITEAKKTTDGLAVLAFFIKVEEENKNYASLINELENVKYKVKNHRTTRMEKTFEVIKSNPRRRNPQMPAQPSPLPQEEAEEMKTKQGVNRRGQTVQMDPLPLSALLPPEEDLGKYYRYEGSLTTPDCHEGVIWTVFEKPVELSISQILQFLTVHFDKKNSTSMAENFRPVQFLKERKVYWSSASSLLPTAKVLTLVLMLTYILSSLSQ